jgi:benzoyl-CoA reductase/2-hydroxyglutaryl-CoA dehydratase subunit BcrC/BadD/HgdB
MGSLSGFTRRAATFLYNNRNLMPRANNMGPTMGQMAKMAMTSTIPVELVLAAGLRPVDLNNRFISAPHPAALVEQAEGLGLPRTLCAWIKGIYAWCLEHPEVDSVLAVTQGDCSNTQALMELLALAGRRVLRFEYPHDRDPATMAANLARLAAELGVSLAQGEEARRALAPLRRDLALLDELTWTTGQISGAENHLWLVSASDFDGDPTAFHAGLRRFLAEALARRGRPPVLRLGLLGVPPIMSDLHQAVAELGGDIVFNEVPRQFAMLPPHEEADDDLVRQYLRYTYPYDVFHRIEDIARQSARRGLAGLIHYTQTFCFRQVQDLVLRARLDLPILTLEGDATGPADARTRLRLEAFLERLR